MGGGDNQSQAYPQAQPEALPSPPYQPESAVGRLLRDTATTFTFGDPNAMDEIRTNPTSMKSMSAYMNAVLAASALMGGGEGRGGLKSSDIGAREVPVGAYGVQKVSPEIADFVDKYGYGRTHLNQYLIDAYKSAEIGNQSGISKNLGFLKDDLKSISTDYVDDEHIQPLRDFFDYDFKPKTPYETTKTQPDVVPTVPSGETGRQWYNASHKDITSFAPREVKSVDSLGTWVTSSPENARIMYGPKVHNVEIGEPKLLEFDGTDRSSGDFTRVIGANQYIAAAVGFPKEAKILSETLPDRFRLRELTDKLNSDEYLTPSEHAERRSLQLADNASNTLLRSPKYMQAFRDYLRNQGYDGILWKNSRIDTQSTDPSHDVAVIFHDEPLPVKEK